MSVHTCTRCGSSLVFDDLYEVTCLACGESRPKPRAVVREPASLQSVDFTRPARTPGYSTPKSLSRDDWERAMSR